MKYFLKIKNYDWAPGSQKKMIYEDEDGKRFMGPPISAPMQDTIVVEASNHPIDGYYQIIQFIGSFANSKKK